MAADPFDILFTDIVMPGRMDGLARSRKLSNIEHPSDILPAPRMGSIGQTRRDELLEAI